MKLSKYPPLCCLALLFSLGGPLWGETETERLHLFFERTYKEDLERSPITQTFRGIKWDYGEWNDFSDERSVENHRIDLERKKELEGFDRSSLSESDLLSLKLYELDLQDDLDSFAFRHHQYIMNQFRAIHTTVPSFLINTHKVTSVLDAEAYISRLEKVEPLMVQIVENMRIREQMGIFPPDWSYPMMLEAINNVVKGAPFEADGDDSPVLADFRKKVDRLEIDASEKEALIEKAIAALKGPFAEGYGLLFEETESQSKIAPALDGVWKLPDGLAYYKNRLRHFTSTNLEADDVHSLGLEQVERIHRQMLTVMKEVNFDGDLQAFFKFMREDPRFYYEDTDEGRDAYLAQAVVIIKEMRDRLPEIFGILPEADIVVKRVEPFREKAAGKAFYQSPAKDGSRPGTYYANLYDMSSMPKYQMEALAYHEGIPGHHMQRSIQMELENVPDFQRYLGMTAYTEGWGLYAELLPSEIGFYKDPYSEFGRLSTELWRACRLVVDTGIHAMKWSREDAISYLLENTPNSEGECTKAIERYLVLPGQATAYLIGQMKIVEVREWVREQLGDAFDIRAFHDEVLKDGPVPLFLLEEKIRSWVGKELAAM